MTDTLNGGDADDLALFEQITNPTTEAATEQEPAPEDNPVPNETRTDLAADKPNSDKPAETLVEKPEVAPEPSIPPSRLREEAEARRQAEREATELRARLAALEAVRQSAPAQAPEQAADPFADFLSDPNAFVGRALTPVQQEMQRQRLSMSMLMAQDKYGSDIVKAADDALGELGKSNRAEAELVAKRMAASPHPYRDLVEWHKRQTALREIGDDPAAYKQRLRDELLKDPEFVKQVVEQARASAQTTTSVQPAAPSFPTLSNIGSPAGGGSAEPQSDAELFASTIRRKR